MAKSRCFHGNNRIVQDASKCLEKERPFKTEFKKRSLLHLIFRAVERVEAGFTAGQVSSDGGGLRLRAGEGKINLPGATGRLFSRRSLTAAGGRPAFRDASAAHLRAGAGLRGPLRS